MKINKKNTKIIYIVFVCIFIVMILISDFVLCSQKGVDFCDEALTYESANSVWKESVFEKDNIWLHGEDFSQYLSATDWNPHFITISRKLWTDHVPFYFWLFRTVSLVFHGSCSPWIGMGLNIVLEIIFMIIFFKVIYKNWNDKTYCLFATCVFAVLYFGIFPLLRLQVTLIRMYLLLILELLVFIWIISKYIYGEDRELILGKKEKIVYFLTVSAGMLTHYLFWPFYCLYTFFVAVYLFVKKEKANVFEVIKISLADIVFVTVIDPYWIYRLVKYNIPKSTGNGNFLNGVVQAINDTVKVLFSYVFLDKLSLIWAVILILAVFAVFVYSCVKNNHYGLLKVIIFLLFADFIFMAVVQLVYHRVDRYCYPSLGIWIASIFVILSYLLSGIFRKTDKIRIGEFFLALSLIMVISVCAISSPFADREYLGDKETMAEQEIYYKDVPWLVYVEGITWREWCSMYNFMIPEDIAFIYSEKEYSEKLELKEDELIVWVTSEEEKALDKAIQYLSSITDREIIISDEMLKMRYLHGYKILFE